MKLTYLLLISGVLALAACEKKETTVIPAPSGPTTSKEVIREKNTTTTTPTPGPSGPPGPQGAPGAPGPEGPKGDGGSTTVIVPPPSTDKK